MDNRSYEIAAAIIVAATKELRAIEGGRTVKEGNLLAGFAFAAFMIEAGTFPGFAGSLREILSDREAAAEVQKWMRRQHAMAVAH